MLFEPEELVSTHPFRVELDLDLDVAGGGPERAGDLAGEPLVRVIRLVEHVVAAVALAGQRFEHLVVQSLDPEPARVERDTLGAHVLDECRQALGFGVPEVGGAVGEQDDPVLRVGMELLTRFFGGQFEGGLDVGAAFAREPGDDLDEVARLVPRDLVGEQLRAAGEPDQGHLVLGLEHRGEDRERAAHGGGAVGALHRPGPVEHEGQAQRRPRRPAGGGGAHRDPQQVALLHEWMGGLLHRAGDFFGLGRQRVAVIERIDEFLGPDFFPRRPLVPGQRVLGQLERDVADMEREC